MLSYGMGQKSRKKRIVVFIPEFPVLTETFIQRDLVRLVESGILDLRILYLKSGSGALDEALKPLSHKIGLNLIDILFSLRYFLARTEEIKKIKHILKGDLTKNGLARLYLLIKSLAYANIIKNYKPQELHIHFYSDFSTIGMFVAIVLGIPFSISVHARDVFEYPHLPKSKAELAKFITVCNKAAYERCLAISEAKPGKVYLIHHGIDPKKTFPSQVSGVKPDLPMIFMGGSRLTEKKGVDYMLQASKILKDRGIKHRVDLVGVGDKYSEIEKRAQELGLDNTFFLHGGGKGLPFEKLAEFYLVADLFVLPIVKSPLGDADGIPNVIIEAALAKLPVITTDAGSVGELIIDDTTGVVVPQRNAEVLATEIEKLLLDEPRRKRLAEGAYNRALEMFDPAKNTDKLEKLLLS